MTLRRISGTGAEVRREETVNLEDGDERLGRDEGLVTQPVEPHLPRGRGGAQLPVSDQRSSQDGSLCSHSAGISDR